MYHAKVMGIIHCLSQLDGNVVNFFDVRSWHVDCKVQIQSLDVLVDVSSIVSLNHGKFTLTDLICEAIKSSCDV